MKTIWCALRAPPKMIRFKKNIKFKLLLLLTLRLFKEKCNEIITTDLKMKRKLMKRAKTYSMSMKISSWISSMKMRTISKIEINLTRIKYENNSAF